MKGTAGALLLVNGKYLLQLRDNNPAINMPNMWCGFGGHKLTGEKDRDAVVREVLEELCIDVSDCEFFGVFSDVPIYVADVSNKNWSLREGQDCDVFSYEQLRKKTNVCPITLEAVRRHSES